MVMAKDPTAFRERVKAYKDGKSVKDIYDGGYIKEPVITPDPQYNEYINSLPDNQRLTPESQYRSHRYWELNDKPKNFGEAIGRGMFTYDFTDNGWHANSVALNKKTGEYEFMKPNWHSTKMYEDAWYYSKDGADFRSEYIKKPGVAYDKYIPKHCNGKLPGYAGGKDPNEDVADFLRQHEGYSDRVYLDGNGIPTIGYGFTDPKFVSKGTISRSVADAELKRQIKSRQNTLRTILGADKWDSLTDDSRKALTSYHFNYPAGFKSNTKFMKAWNAGNYAEAIRQVDAGMNDTKNPGLRTRRLAEQALLKADPFLTGRHEVPIQPIVAQPVSTAVRPIIPAQQTVPAYDTQVSPYISGKPMLHLMPTVSMPDLIQMVEDSQWQPTYADGKLPGYKNGKIYIKPANRGKFTALKKRTGHSASWFKENGTPAQKKMATFALNAKKWHHADGKLPKYEDGTIPDAEKAKAATNSAVAFAKSYYNSPGFNERFRKFTSDQQGFLHSQYNPNASYWKNDNYWYPGTKYSWSVKREPLRFSGMSMIPESDAKYDPQSGTVYYGDSNTTQRTNANWEQIMAHELGHALDYSIKVYNKNMPDMTEMAFPYGYTYSNMFPILRKSKSYQYINSAYTNTGDGKLDAYGRTNEQIQQDRFPTTVNLPGSQRESHDARPEESYADLFALRKRLNDFGIFDSRKSGQLFEQKHLDQYRKLEKSRLFDNFSDSDIIWMMNNIAGMNARKLSPLQKQV